MEIIIILIVVGIIGYVFYQTLPNPKFQQASSLFDSANYDKATIILESIFTKHPESPSKLAECKLMQGRKVQLSNEALRYFSDAVELKKQLPSIADKNKFELVEAKVQFEISLIKFHLSIEISSTEIKVKSLKDNLLFIDSVIQSGIESDFSQLKNKHYFELTGLYYSSGLECEKEKQYGKAIRNYKSAKDYSTKTAQLEIRYNSIVRIGICKLKENPKEVEFVSLDDYNKANIEIAQDFFYRYSIYLLKKESYIDAETILNTHLNIQTQTLDQLKELLRTKRIKQAVLKVEVINSTIEQLYEKSFPVDEVKALYENLDIQIKEIKDIVPNLVDKLKTIKPSLFNRLLSHYLAEKQFANGVNLIQNYPSFWESPELLKNLGICCYGFTADGNLTPKNYRIIISNWLTSVFSDKVILKSLDSTTWDDNYTFTLIESIGSNFQRQNDLSENANYDVVSDTNISIGETQRELINQFETLLHKTISEPILSKAVHEFYEEEKEAIENIVSLINNDIIFATPHFAKTYGLHDQIIQELDNDYAEYFIEDSLEAGIPYLKDNADTYVSEYATTRDVVSTIINAIEDEKLSELKSVFTNDNSKLIGKYDSINDSLEDTIHNAFTRKIDEDCENENLIPLMEECIRFADDNVKLKSQCSNFIQEFCDLNWRIKPAVKLLELMIKSIRYNPQNYRAAKSITILINNNLMDIANDKTNSTSQIYTMIEEVKKIHSEVLKDSLKELLILRKKVLFSIGDEAARTISMGLNLNSTGMKMKRVLDTMQSLGGVSTSANLFDF